MWRASRLAVARCNDKNYTEIECTVSTEEIMPIILHTLRHGTTSRLASFGRDSVCCGCRDGWAVCVSVCEKWNEQNAYCAVDVVVVGMNVTRTMRVLVVVTVASVVVTCEAPA